MTIGMLVTAGMVISMIIVLDETKRLHDTMDKLIPQGGQYMIPQGGQYLQIARMAIVMCSSVLTETIAIYVLGCIVLPISIILAIVLGLRFFVYLCDKSNNQTELILPAAVEVHSSDGTSKKVSLKNNDEISKEKQE